jgi:hypothetical protein
VFHWDAEEVHHVVTRSVDDETTKSPHGGRDEALHSDRNISSHFPTALGGGEAPSIPGLDVDIHDNLLAMRLVRHFKEGPGQW